MQRKVTVCATEAAVISIGIHLLLLFFAGSMVVLNVARKEAAAFKGEKIDRPKPERRAVQLPVKIQELQKSSPRPKITTRIVSAATLPFTMPAMTLPETSFKPADNGEALKSQSSRGMPGSLDIGVTGVNFFGTRSKGEKIVFILDASKQMMEDAKGGYTTYKFAKDKIHHLVDAMPAATLFNVMVYNDSNVDMFRPEPVPATQANRDSLKTWLAPINSNPNNVGQVRSMYRPSMVYQSDIGAGVRSWLKAVQAAMEQTADSIFVLCGGFGRYYAAAARQSGSVERDEKQMAAYRAKLDAMKGRAMRAFEAENKAREAKGLPPKIVYDWDAYITDELRLVPPSAPVTIGVGSASSSVQNPEQLVVNHMDAVWSYHYTSQELMPPRVNFVYLVASDASMPGGNIEVMALRNTAEAFRGDFEFLRGARTMRNLIQNISDIR